MSELDLNRATETLVTRAAKAVPLRVLSVKAAESWLAKQGKETKAWAKANGFTGQPGQTLLLAGQGGTVKEAVAVVKDRDGLWGYAGLAAKLPAGSYVLAPDLPDRAAARAALGWALGGYRFTRYKESKAERARLVWPKGVDRQEVTACAEATTLVRDIINTPAEDMGPPELAEVARQVAKAGGAKLRVTTGEELLKKNYPAIHTVGRAAAKAPRLLDLSWKGPGSQKGLRVTLVGKGVCFDSGGLDIKPASGMLLMKKDMGGSAHVLGLAHWIMKCGLPLQLRVLVPAVENAISGNAYRPGDVVRTRKGLTVEVGNTDAEGRVVLADALAEASQGKPDMILDFATLTGAARVALGPDLPALFCNDESLAAALLNSGENEGDPLWRLPLHAPYRKMIESKVADISNTGSGPHAGAITAALFLERFVESSIPWAHLDVMAWNSSGRAGRPVGGEAMGLRAVYEVIRRHAVAPPKAGKG